jgi:poly-gamma-glutamate biosynthesis protein PgsC/CapC
MHLETLFIGILVALVYAEITGLYPGGIIVPAFIALSLDQPLRALPTLLAAVMSLLVYKAVSRYFIIFGKRRFVFMLLFGAFWSQLWLFLIPLLPLPPPELRVVGLIIPGLLANNLERQRFLPTLASLVTVVVIIYFLANILGMAR